MVIDFSKFTISDYAAWWGAVIATLALIWNIVIAARSGARVKVRVSPNMKIFPSDPATKDNRYVSVTAVNHGTAPTTITNCCGYYAPTFWDLLGKKNKQLFEINTNPLLGKSIPHLLSPGEEWSNMALQQSFQEDFSGGYLYIGIAHNQRPRPIYKRVKLKVL